MGMSTCQAVYFYKGLLLCLYWINLALALKKISCYSHKEKLREDKMNHLGRYWQKLDDGRIQCDVCPRQCRMHNGQRGLCFVRQAEEDQIVLTTYGRSSGFCIDPIEKSLWITSCRGHQFFLLAPLAAISPVNFVRTGTSASPVSLTGLQKLLLRKWLHMPQKITVAAVLLLHTMTRWFSLNMLLISHMPAVKWT